MNTSELQQLKKRVVDLSGTFSEDQIEYQADQGRTERPRSRLVNAAALATLGVVLGGAIATLLDLLFGPASLNGWSGLGSVLGGLIGLGVGTLPRPKRATLAVIAITFLVIATTFNTTLLGVLLWQQN